MLTHLMLGAYLPHAHSWDAAFGSQMVQHLTHPELVNTHISHVVLACIAHVHNLVSLTLHGMLNQPAAATAIFGTDHVLPITSMRMTCSQPHAFFLHLEAFRFAFIRHNDDNVLFIAVVQFLRMCPHLCKLDLGTCWELVCGLLPELTGLRVIHLACSVSDRPMVHLRFTVYFRLIDAGWENDLSTDMRTRLHGSGLWACCTQTACRYGIRSRCTFMEKSYKFRQTCGSRMRVTWLSPWQRHGMGRSHCKVDSC